MKSTSPSTRQDILREIKMRGGASQSELADALGLTREAVRLQLAQLEQRGWVASEAMQAAGRGRPTKRWMLTAEGEEAFPKFYDVLTINLLKTMAGKLGEDGLRDVLTDITDQQVEAWQSRLDGKPLNKRIDALRGIYFDKDPFTSVQRDKDGAMLVEHNCPYLTAALEEPRLCSVTLSTMKRLLGVEVERTERFQHGDGRCIFRIKEKEAVPKRFRFEWEDE